MRTDLVPTLVKEFNDIATCGQVDVLGSDISSCLTNITHTLALSAWDFYCACLRTRVQAISAPKRGRKGMNTPRAYSPGTRNHLLTLTIEQIGIIIMHHLATGWFLLGTLAMRQIEGLPMGSALGSALTRMVSSSSMSAHHVIRPTCDPTCVPYQAFGSLRF